MPSEGIDRANYRWGEVPKLVKDIVDAAINYIEIRDFLGGHLSPEGKRLNEAVKKYIEYKNPPDAVSER